MQGVESLYKSDLTLSEEEHYDRSWATALVTCALSGLGTEFGAGPKARIFDELKPFLCGGTDLPSQREIARRLDIPINTLRSHLLRLRVRYAELLRQEVARTIGSADDVDEELRRFRKILVE